MAGLRGFAKRGDGVTSIEYALIASLAAIAIVVGTTQIGTTLASLFAQLTPAL